MLRHQRAQGGDAVARGGEIGQRGAFVARLGEPGLGLGDVGGEAARGLLQGGKPRARRLHPLHRRVVGVARAGCGAERRLQGGPPGALGIGGVDRDAARLDEAGLGRGERLVGAGELAGQLVEPVLLGQPGGGGGRGAAPDREAVPAPQRAIAADQALALGQKAVQCLALGLVRHHADLAQAAGERWRAADMGGQGLEPVGQGRRAGILAERVPEHRRAGVGRGGQVVAERGAERGLVAGVDGDRIDQRRPQLGIGGGEQAGQGVRLGGDPGAGRLRGLEAFAHLAFGGDRRQPGLLGLGRLALGALQGRLGLVGGAARRQHLEIGVGLFRQPGAFGRDLRAARLEALDPRLELADAPGQRRRPRLVGGDLLGQLTEFALVAVDGGLRLGRDPGGVGDRLGLAGGGGGQFLGLAVEPLVGRRRVGGERRFARPVAVDLGEARAHVGERRLDPLLLLVERAARDGVALQLGRGFGLGLAQGRQLRHRLALRGRRRGRRRRRLDHRGLGRPQGRRRRCHAGVELDPLLVQQDRLGAAKLVVDVAIADRLAGLLLERVELALERHDHVVEACQVGFRRAQAQLGLVPAGMQPGDPGRLLEQAAPLGRLGVDQRADPALADQGGGMRAGRRIREQQLHVAGAVVLAVDPVVGAFATLDPAVDLDLVEIVELGRDLAVVIGQGQRHLGDVARRPVGAAAEDDVVHLAAAHALGRGLAHHPAQRLDQVRLAAAVRADDAGHARLDQQLGRVDERLEAAQPEFRELNQTLPLQGLNALPAGRS